MAAGKQLVTVVLVLVLVLIPVLHHWHVRLTLVHAAGRHVQGQGHRELELLGHHHRVLDQTPQHPCDCCEANSMTTWVGT